MKTIKSIALILLCIGLICIPRSVSAQTTSSTNYKTIYDMLKDVPGLEVRTNNGRGNSVVIRGVGTLTSSSAPLFVVDGVIFSGDVSNLNPQDIANIIVLKDAASTTAYGAQGANGVISITTKKGSSGSTPVSASEHTESAYKYFIDHKTPLRVIGQDDGTIIEGIIEKQRGDTLIFIKKRKEFPVPVSNVKKVEMLPQQ